MTANGMFQGDYRDFKDKKEFPVEWNICKTCPHCQPVLYYSATGKDEGKSYRCCVNPMSCKDIADTWPSGEIHSWYGIKTPQNCTMYLEYMLFYDDKDKKNDHS